MMNKKWKRHSLYWLFYAVYYVVINWWQNVAMSLWLVLLTVPYFAFVFYSVYYLLERYFRRGRYLLGTLLLLLFYTVSGTLVYADMQNGKLYLHLQDGTSLETNSTFGRIMELLPSKWFMECAKGVVFNINFYKGVVEGAVVLTALKEGGQENLTLPKGSRQAFPDFSAFVDSNIL